MAKRVPKNRVEDTCSIIEKWAESKLKPHIIDFLHYFALVIFVFYLIIWYFENVQRTLKNQPMWQKNVEKPSLIHFFFSRL